MNKVVDKACFITRCRRLPKGLKEWQAFLELKKKIDDFSESCPLLELMANKAMKERHWDRMAKLTGHTFDFDSENFTLRDIMKAPLLKYKEDIEVMTFLLSFFLLTLCMLGNFAFLIAPFPRPINIWMIYCIHVPKHFVP